MIVYSRSGHKLSFIRIYLHLFFFIRSLIFSCICFPLCNFSLVCNISTQVSPGRLSRNITELKIQCKNTIFSQFCCAVARQVCFGETSEYIRRNILIHRLNLRNDVSVKDVTAQKTAANETRRDVTRVGRRLGHAQRAFCLKIYFRRRFRAVAS